MYASQYKQWDGSPWRGARRRTWASWEARWWGMYITLSLLGFTLEDLYLFRSDFGNWGQLLFSFSRKLWLGLRKSRNQLSRRWLFVKAIWTLRGLVSQEIIMHCSRFTYLLIYQVPYFSGTVCVSVLMIFHNNLSSVWHLSTWWKIRLFYLTSRLGISEDIGFQH